MTVKVGIDLNTFSKIDFIIVLYNETVNDIKHFVSWVDFHLQLYLPFKKS